MKTAFRFIESWILARQVSRWVPDSTSFVNLRTGPNPASSRRRTNRAMATTAKDEKESTYQVRALERGLSILETVADAGEALSLSEIAKRHDLNLSTAFRLVRVLTQLRWLDSDDQSNQYRLGIRAFEVGSSYLGQLGVEVDARPFLETLAQDTGQTASLGILEEADVVYVGIVRGQAEVGIQSRIGARHPAYCTAPGKVLMSELDQSALDKIINAGMPRLTENTITTPDVLRHVP